MKDMFLFNINTSNQVIHVGFSFWSAEMIKVSSLTQWEEVQVYAGHQLGSRKHF